MPSREQIEKAARMIRKFDADSDWFIAAETDISIPNIQQLRATLKARQVNMAGARERSEEGL